MGGLTFWVAGIGVLGHWEYLIEGIVRGSGVLERGSVSEGGREGGREGKAEREREMC